MPEVLFLKFPDGGLIPVIVQERKTGEVLMMAYANDEAVRLTQTTGFAHYYSQEPKKTLEKRRRERAFPEG